MGKKMRIAILLSGLLISDAIRVAAGVDPALTDATGKAIAAMFVFCFISDIIDLGRKRC